ncbi:hypothetical protein [Streptomyces sp. NPDC047000]|uniref:hypothetical protein n=1 Tax=Streptomyces sp. NPDC047000 TaxID=3155474 RepID=UPI0034061317
MTDTEPTRDTNPATPTEPLAQTEEPAEPATPTEESAEPVVRAEESAGPVVEASARAGAAGPVVEASAEAGTGPGGPELPAAPEAAAADGGDAPQGPPAPDHETRTGGAGGNTPAEGGAEAPAPVSVPAPAPTGRRRATTVTGIALALTALAAGIGFTVVTVQGADRDPGHPVWHLPKAGGAEAKAPAPKGLAATLVPYDGEWTPGPDLAQFGSDTQLSGAEATALRKESLRDLPRTQRKRMEQLIDKQHIKGMAMRSYLLDNSHYDDRHSATVSIVLSQLEDQAAVKESSTFENRFMDALGIFRKGPAVKGHPNAKCFQPPKDAEEKIDAMVCSAYEGDVLVTVNAGGPKTMATADIAKLLETQLDRIKEPGKSV